MKLLLTHWRLFAAAAAAGSLAVALYLRQRQRRHDPRRIEQQRRQRLHRIGRIVEAEIVDLIDLPRSAADSSSRRTQGAPLERWVVYRYTISGVTYEAAQEVPASSAPWPSGRRVANVKYDPANPADSMLLLPTAGAD